MTINGITGVRDSFAEELEQHFRLIKQFSNLPILAGFGISTADHIREMNRIADGVVVGSAIVDAFYREDKEFIEELMKVKRVLLVVE